MRSILEKAIVHLLNEEHEQAEALFHKFMVERARQIHESLRTGEDALLESFDDINSDEMFTEDDLAGLEDDGEEAAEFGGEATGDEVGGESEAAGDEFGGEDMGSDDLGGDEAAADDLGDDLGAEGGEGEVEDRIADLEDQLEKLTAEFESMMGGEGDDLGAEGDLGGDDMGGDLAGDEAAFGGEVDADLDSSEGGDIADSMEDDMGEEGEEKQFGESAGDSDEDEDDKDEDGDEFDDITESIVSELEKVMVSMTDGKEIAAGKSFTQNNKSPALQKKPNVTQDGKPVQVKATEHQGFERETAPAVKDMKKRKNTKSKGTEGQSGVSKEGDKSALINKTPGAEAQTHSPLAKR